MPTEISQGRSVTLKGPLAHRSAKNRAFSRLPPGLSTPRAYTAQSTRRHIIRHTGSSPAGGCIARNDRTHRLEGDRVSATTRASLRSARTNHFSSQLAGPRRGHLTAAAGMYLPHSRTMITHTRGCTPPLCDAASFLRLALFPECSRESSSLPSPDARARRGNLEKSRLTLLLLLLSGARATS